MRIITPCTLERFSQSTSHVRELDVMLLEEIRSELGRLADPAVRKKSIVWEKQYYESPQLYGLPAAVVRKISSRFYQQVKKFSKREIFGFCEELLGSEMIEERAIAFDWAFRVKKDYERSDFHVFGNWLKKYVHGWGGCDDLCTHAFWAFLFQFPEFVSNVKEWAGSKNRWLRRACAVVTIYSVQRKKHLENVFEIADLLLTDSDVMVQKGYGWMLKEASNHYPQEVFDYVMKHKLEMPRTALRYAIEKMPSRMKTEAMKK